MTKENEAMETLTLDLPSMYADHHVLRVRDALSALKGVKDVYASSAWQQVMISYDPKALQAGEIEEALKSAGYPPGEGGPPILVEASAIKRDPQWQILDLRMTKTQHADIEMSGEFRRY